MKNTKYIRIALNVITLLTFTSCTTTQEITRRSELIHSDDFGEIEILTEQNETYILEEYKLKDSVIMGKGFKSSVGAEQPFKGEIKLNTVKKIQGTGTSTGRILYTAGIITAFTIVFLVFASKENDSRNVVHFATGSCNNFSLKNQKESSISAAGFSGKNKKINPEILKAKVFRVIRENDVIEINNGRISIIKTYGRDEILFDKEKSTIIIDIRPADSGNEFLFRNGMNESFKLFD